jgi:hypothetical protein
MEPGRPVSVSYAVRRSANPFLVPCTGMSSCTESIGVVSLAVDGCLSQE